MGRPQAVGVTVGRRWAGGRGATDDLPYRYLTGPGQQLEVADASQSQSYVIGEKLKVDEVKKQ